MCLRRCIAAGIVYFTMGRGDIALADVSFRHPMITKDKMIVIQAFQPFARAPQIAGALEALTHAGAAFARMAGSGATCFGLFERRGAGCTKDNSNYSFIVQQ